MQTINCPYCGRQINVMSVSERESAQSKAALTRELPSDVGYCNIQSFEESKNLSPTQRAQVKREHLKGFV